MLRYLQVMDWVREYIRQEGLREGDRLPTEAELTRRLGVSTVTVRHAMAELQRQGLISRQQGRGTFVRRPRIASRPTRPGGLRETLVEPAGTLTARLLEFRRRPCSREEANALSLPDRTPVFQVVRLREVDGRPAVIDRSVIPVQLAPTLSRADVDRLEGSLYDLLGERYNLQEGWEEQAITAVAPGREERELLSLGACDPVLVVRGTSFTARGVAFDHFRLTYHAALFEFLLHTDAP
jgi:DNA-binding GntR family transcriptional regulator